MIKDKKVKVNKQKPSDACPAQLMLIVIKCPLIQRPAALAAIPMLAAALIKLEFYWNYCWRFWLDKKPGFKIYLTNILFFHF